MSSKILIVFATAFVLVAGGCAKKKTKTDSMDTGGQAQDTNVQNKDLNFTAQGSDSGTIDGLETVHFDYDKYSLTSEARTVAQQDAKWIKSHKTKVQIEGHCDRHGSIEYNLALGERRAKAVRAYLLSLGVPSRRLSVISYGKEKLLDTAETEAADAKNRRANFLPLTK